MAPEVPVGDEELLSEPEVDVGAELDAELLGFESRGITDCPPELPPRLLAAMESWAKPTAGSGENRKDV